MEPTSTPTPPAAGPIHLLVVDDDQGIRTLLEVTISLDDRFSLLALAASGEEALERLRACAGRTYPDVVLLDVTLPDRDGIELVADLRATSPTSRIALFTGWSDDETIARARAAGAEAVFGKDGNPRGLMDALADLAAQPRD